MHVVGVPAVMKSLSFSLFLDVTNTTACILVDLTYKVILLHVSTIDRTLKRKEGFASDYTCLD